MYLNKYLHLKMQSLVHLFVANFLLFHTLRPFWMILPVGGATALQASTISRLTCQTLSAKGLKVDIHLTVRTQQPDDLFVLRMLARQTVLHIIDIIFCLFLEHHRD